MASTTTTKVTKMNVIDSMLADKNIVSNATYKAYLENEKAILIKKRNNKKATKTQVENENVINEILNTMATLKVGATITEIQCANADLKALSNQKVSALMRILIDRGLVEKTTSKGKSLFSLYEEENDEIEENDEEADE